MWWPDSVNRNRVQADSRDTQLWRAAASKAPRPQSAPLGGRPALANSLPESLGQRGSLLDPRAVITAWDSQTSPLSSSLPQHNPNNQSSVFTRRLLRAVDESISYVSEAEFRDQFEQDKCQLIALWEEMCVPEAEWGGFVAQFFMDATEANRYAIREEIKRVIDHRHSTVQVVQHILCREDALQAIRGVLQRHLDGEAAHAVMQPLLGLLEQYRHATLACHEALQRWQGRIARDLGGLSDVPFMWQGQNYGHKMLTDLNFLDESPLAQLLPYAVLNNPFLDPSVLPPRPVPLPAPTPADPRHLLLDSSVASSVPGPGDASGLMGHGGESLSAPQTPRADTPDRATLGGDDGASSSSAGAVPAPPVSLGNAGTTRLPWPRASTPSGLGVGLGLGLGLGLGPGLPLSSVRASGRALSPLHSSPVSQQQQQQQHQTSGDGVAATIAVDVEAEGFDLDAFLAGIAAVVGVEPTAVTALNTRASGGSRVFVTVQFSEPNSVLKQQRLLALIYRGDPGLVELRVASAVPISTGTGLPLQPSIQFGGAANPNSPLGSDSLGALPTTFPLRRAPGNARIVLGSPLVTEADITAAYGRRPYASLRGPAAAVAAAQTQTTPTPSPRLPAVPHKAAAVPPLSLSREGGTQTTPRTNIAQLIPPAAAVVAPLLLPGPSPAETNPPKTEPRTEPTEPEKDKTLLAIEAELRELKNQIAELEKHIDRNSNDMQKIECLTSLQATCRARLSMLAVSERRFHVRSRAACRIQRAWRRHLARAEATRRRQAILDMKAAGRREEAATDIQRNYRRHTAQRRVKHMRRQHAALLPVQAACRACLASALCAARRQEQLRAEIARQQTVLLAGHTLQRAFRSYLARKECARRKQLRTGEFESLRQTSDVADVQRLVRGWLARRRARSAFQKIHKRTMAVHEIQRWARALPSLLLASGLRQLHQERAVGCIQQYIRYATSVWAARCRRAVLLRALERALREKKAAITIQCWQRRMDARTSVKARKELLALNTALEIQVEREYFTRAEAAMILVQSFARAAIARRLTTQIQDFFAVRPVTYLLAATTPGSDNAFPVLHMLLEQGNVPQAEPEPAISVTQPPASSLKHGYPVRSALPLFQQLVADTPTLSLLLRLHWEAQAIRVQQFARAALSCHHVAGSFLRNPGWTVRMLCDIASSDDASGFPALLAVRGCFEESTPASSPAKDLEAEQPAVIEAPQVEAEEPDLPRGETIYPDEDILRGEEATNVHVPTRPVVRVPAEVRELRNINMLLMAGGGPFLGLDCLIRCVASYHSAETTKAHEPAPTAVSLPPSARSAVAEPPSPLAAKPETFAAAEPQSPTAVPLPPSARKPSVAQEPHSPTLAHLPASARSTPATPRNPVPLLPLVSRGLPSMALPLSERSVGSQSGRLPNSTRGSGTLSRQTSARPAVAPEPEPSVVVQPAQEKESAEVPAIDQPKAEEKQPGAAVEDEAKVQTPFEMLDLMRVVTKENAPELPGFATLFAVIAEDAASEAHQRREAAATTIQLAHRCYKARREVTARKEQRTVARIIHLRRREAAITLQSFFSGVRDRQKVAKLRAEREALHAQMLREKSDDEEH